MTEPTTAAVKKKEPFIYQAAVAGLWAPVIAIVLGIATAGIVQEPAKNPSGVIILAVVKLGLLVVGFALSATALAGIPWYGRKRLLGRGLVGLGLSGAFLSFVVIGLFHGPTSSIEKRLAGTWEWRNDALGLSHRFEFSADKRFRLVFGGAETGEITGTWYATTKSGEGQFNFVLVLQPEATKGMAAADVVGRKIGYTILESSDNHVTLDYAGGKRTYMRAGVK